MASKTPFLDLYKKDPVIDKLNTFNITTMLNDNWDKIDAAMKANTEDDARHIENDMPHIMTDLSTGKKYRYGRRKSVNGIPQTISKEVE